MTPTRDLLRRWHQGDQEALGELVALNASWIADHVHRRLGPLVRARADTQDIVQQTLVEVLNTGPRFLVDDREQLRALLARMVENVLRYLGLSVDNLPADVVRSATPILVETRDAAGKSSRMPATPDLVFAEGAQLVMLGTHEAVRQLREGTTGA